MFTIVLCKILCFLKLLSVQHYIFCNCIMVIFFVNRRKFFGSPLNDIVFVNISKRKFEHRVVSKTYRSVFIISHVIRYIQGH